MNDGSYRYASWSIDAKMISKPDLIIKNGKLNIEGTIRNRLYTFKNGNYTYKCYISNIKRILSVYKNEKEILKQNASIVN